ncbi:MAG: cytochrome c3 family protein [Thermodesulfovibrionales bacterium]|nr:cytochrome c3 family protein [Thermodesulfovibrionales bacterium]
MQVKLKKGDRFVFYFRTVPVCVLLVVFMLGTSGFASAKQISQETSACLSCHEMVTPGIVKDWRTSLHSNITPSDAFKKPELTRMVSTQDINKKLASVVVGCYECHGLNKQSHKDNFEHNGFKINIVVSPKDCATCHLDEVTQYSNSKKAHAIKNLVQNPVYSQLIDATISQKILDKGILKSSKPTTSTQKETCLGCHGTSVKVEGIRDKKTQMGDMRFPVLSGWPNVAVGRENPDGSLGACTSCHPRHSFSIEIARKPYTCAQCHLDPDVPAWNVYKESKHGNIYFSKWHEWDFKNPSWTLGKDFKAPTCATCHNSQVVSPDGNTIAKRTHDFGSRLWVRLFGLIYSHPQPKHGDTTKIRNKDGLPLPTTLTGAYASDGLISKDEQQRRLSAMKTICNGCHSENWVDGHFQKLHNTIKETDSMVYTSTMLMMDVWKSKVEDKTNLFDESIEKMWVRQWLFYANSIRYASAMTGAPDYATFKNGWWNMNETLQHMNDWFKFKRQTRR